MKLNFDLCKKCTFAKFKWFDKYEDFIDKKKKFTFSCSTCYYFILSEDECPPEKFNRNVFIENITDKEWEWIKKLEVIKFPQEGFNKCPFKLEHLVE